MPRHARASNTVTHLARFLAQTRKENKLTLRQAAKIAANVHPSVFSSWEKGSSPALESIPALKQFCDHFKVSLSFALTGQPDTPTHAEGVEAMFHEQEFFDGYARIKLMRLIPKSEMKKKEPS